MTANLSGEHSLYPNLSQSSNCLPQRSAEPLGSESFVDAVAWCRNRRGNIYQSPVEIGSTSPLEHENLHRPGRACHADCSSPPHRKTVRSPRNLRIMSKDSLMWRNTRPFNLSGLPTISMPCGFTKAGLPIGLQLSTAPWREAAVLRLAHAYEQRTSCIPVIPGSPRTGAVRETEKGNKTKCQCGALCFWPVDGQAGSYCSSVGLVPTTPISSVLDFLTRCRLLRS